MEILLIPISLIVGGYIVKRLFGRDIKAIVEEWKEIIGVLTIMVVLLGLAGALLTAR